jgi:mitochondrial import inner membrane translocase subunit TIM17
MVWWTRSCFFDVVLFFLGVVGGTVWHTIGGARNAPKGQRIAQALSRARARVPILGGSFAVWGVLYSCCDCTLTYYRKKVDPIFLYSLLFSSILFYCFCCILDLNNNKCGCLSWLTQEDPWNAILSGAATGGILAARAGLKAAGRSAFAGGMVLAAIEGLNLVLMRVLMPSMEQQQLAQSGAIVVDQLLPPSDPARPRISRTKSKPLWDTAPAPSSMFPVFNTETAPAPAWEAQGFNSSSSTGFSAGYESDSSSNSSGETSSETSKASSWKFW